MDTERVCSVEDVPHGTMRGFTVKYAHILLANVDGNFYAVTGVCPHMGGYLPIGVLEGKLIKCPVHGSQYDVTTGKLVKDVPFILRILTGGGSNDLVSYPVTVEGGSVFIEL